MQDKPISRQQLAFLIFLLLPGSSLVFLTGSVAAQDAWIATFLASGFGFYVLYVILKLHGMFPGQRITQISTIVLGKIPGTILNLIFLWSIFVILITFLFDIIMLSEVIYLQVPINFLYPLLVLPCAYCFYKGLPVLGLLSEASMPIILFFLVIGLLITLPLMDLANLKPILATWKPLAAGTLYAADWPFDEVVIFALFLPLVSNLKENHSQLYYWYMASALVIFLLDFVMITVLGANLLDIYQFPLYQVFRLAGFGEFQRMELVFFLLWFVTAIITIMIYYQGLNFIVQDLFSLNNFKSLILPLGLCLVVFTLYMFPNTVEYRLYGFKYLPAFSFPVNLLYPTIILLAAKFRQKRQQQKTALNS